MVLLDTHVLLWALDEYDKLSLNARQAIAQNDCSVSVLSLWEMAIKASLPSERRRLVLDRTILDFAGMCEEYRIDILPITPEDCEQVMRLPHIHPDPFDRMIVAQAMTRGLALVTKDENIAQYDGIEVVW